MHIQPHYDLMREYEAIVVAPFPAPVMFVWLAGEETGCSDRAVAA